MTQTVPASVLTTICLVSLNIFILLAYLAILIAMWKYLDSKCLERQTLVDWVTKVIHLVWFLFYLSMVMTSALILLEIRCSPTLALALAYTRQGLMLWAPLISTCKLALQYTYVHYPGLLDDLKLLDYLVVVILCCFTSTIVIMEMVILALTVDLYPKSYYSLQGIPAEGPFTTNVIVIGGQHMTYAISALIIYRSVNKNITSNTGDVRLENFEISYGSYYGVICLVLSVIFTALVGFGMLDVTKHHGLLVMTTHSTLSILWMMSIIVWTNTGLVAYVERKCLFVQLVLARIRGRQNSIQPIHLSGLV